MSLPLIFRDEALADLDEAYLWYEEQRQGLGVEFIQAIESRLEQIQSNQKQFPRIRFVIRRAIVTRFPYAIFFIEQERFISIIAVMHHARSPRHWQRRAPG